VLAKATYTHNLHTKDAERKKCREDEDKKVLQAKLVASPVHRVLLPDCQKKMKHREPDSQLGPPDAATGQSGTWPDTTGSATGLLGSEVENG
jgi:hypothetical protein